MDILEQVRYYANNHGTPIAVQSDDAAFTYEELDKCSDKLATCLDSMCGEKTSPIVVYGHKSAYMIVCFLACVKSGRAYCPVDSSLPLDRVKSIIDIADGPVILAVEELGFSLENAVGLAQLKQILEGEMTRIDESHWLKPEDIFYIIFTSGSTENPKGVKLQRNVSTDF